MFLLIHVKVTHLPTTASIAEHIYLEKFNPK
jgi:hypothetical protein